MGSLRFTATLEPRGPAAAILLDDEQVATIGEGAKRFPVRTTINGFTWRSTVVRMRGEFMLGLSKATRSGAGVETGETVQVEMALDTEDREVEVPEALAQALAGDAAARTAFEGLAHTHRKEFARWVQEAKREQTRERRVTQTLEMLKSGETRS